MKLVLSIFLLLGLVLTSSVLLTASPAGFWIISTVHAKIFITTSATEPSRLAYEYLLTPNSHMHQRLIHIGYTPSEISHLDDVAQVLRLVLVAWIMLVALVIIFGPQNVFRPRITKIVYLMMILLVVVGTAIGLTFWDWAFETFHVLLFPPGTWQFPISSLLISNFPVSYWQTAAVSVVLTAVFTSFSLYLLRSVDKYA